MRKSSFVGLSFAAGLLFVSACASSTTTANTAPAPDPRVGLGAGLMTAAEATSNLKVVAKAQPTGKFLGSTNSDITFTGNYAIQGNYNGYQV
jgi:hypothetical protein